eukprot:3507241-Rhodomonas_salina.1
MMVPGGGPRSAAVDRHPRSAHLCAFAGRRGVPLSLQTPSLLQLRCRTLTQGSAGVGGRSGYAARAAGQAR